jgi:fucose permease
MLLAVVGGAVIWLGGWFGLVLLGIVFAPIFPVLIAETPGRLGMGQTADAVGLQVAAAVVGGASIPALVGVLAARVGLEVVGGALVATALVQLGLYEALVRRAFAPRRSARSQIDAAVSARPRA